MSQSGFKPIMPRQKIYAEIVEQILESIRMGVHAPGTALPSERELAAQLDVSRASLREAVRVLEHAGVLDVRSGSGTYVKAESPSKTTTLRARTALLGEHSPLDLIAVRMTVEPMSARLAAVDHNSRDIEVMKAHLNLHLAMLNANDDPSDADYGFHLAVSAAAHNEVLYDVQQYFTDLMREDSWSGLKRQSRSIGDAARQYLRDHEAVFAAIEAGDGERAANLMAAHLQSIRDTMHENVTP